jgi:hypothetical protein
VEYGEETEKDRTADDTPRFVERLPKRHGRERLGQERPAEQIVRPAVSASRTTRIHTVKRVMVAVILSAVAIIQAACAEDRHERYRTYRELVAAGAGPRSWFPECVPDTAVDLENFHNLDSNETIGTFRVPPAASLSAGCGNAGDFVESRLDPPLAQWPSCLRGPITDQQVVKCGMAAYRDSRYIIVFNQRDGSAYYWSRGS